MERIGRAASKMAKGNHVLYNFYVLLISFLLSLALFLIAGGAIFIGLIAIGAISNGLVPGGLKAEWQTLIQICMVSLVVVVSLVALFAIIRNIKIWKKI